MDEKDEKDLRANVIGQWIFSLAVSVVCCAFLFLLSAYYVTNQNMAVSTVQVRIDVMQQRQDVLSLELDRLRRALAQPTIARPVASLPDLGTTTTEQTTQQDNGAAQSQPVEAVPAPTQQKQ